MPKKTEKWNGVPIIDDGAKPPAPKDMGKGYVPPTDAQRLAIEGTFAPPSEMTLYPESELEDRLKEQWERKQSLYHLWQIYDNGKQPAVFSQGSWGYCWGYSTTNAVMFARCAQGMPYVRLSAHSVSWTLRNGANRGGWCGESAKFIFDRGIVPESIWPNQGSKNYGGWEEARKYRIHEEYRDPARPIHGQQLTGQQIVTCALNNHPMACDDMEWAHSVCYPACVVLEKGVIARMGWNSWANWGDKGWFISRSQRLPMQPDGAIAIRTVTAT
jgi:hypothetical protein